MRNLVTVFGRAGVDLGPVMPYALAGVSFAEGEYRGAFTNPKVIRHLHDRLRGYSVGLGAEFRLHENWSASLEYVYTDFGKQALFDNNMTIDLNQIKAGLSYRF